MLSLASIQVLALGPHVECGKQSLLRKDESERKMSRNGSGQGCREDQVEEQGIQPQAFIH